MTTRRVGVLVPADLSRTGKPFYKQARIDECLADVVEALQAGGVMMRGSCCGHGVFTGSIHLQDGRILHVTGAGGAWPLPIKDVPFDHGCRCVTSSNQLLSSTPSSAY